MPADYLCENVCKAVGSVLLKLRNETCVGNLNFGVIRLLYMIIKATGLYEMAQGDKIKVS